MPQPSKWNVKPPAWYRGPWPKLHDKHFEALVEANRRVTTIEGKRTRLNLFLEMYAKKPIADISPKDVALWIQATGSKARNKRNYEAALQSLFNFAEKYGPAGFKNEVAKFHHQRTPNGNPPQLSLLKSPKTSSTHLRSTVTAAPQLP